MPSFVSHPTSSLSDANTSHPIKYPTIFYEVSWYLLGEDEADMWTNYYPTGGQVWEEGTRYVLSNGDEWGPSYHADFHAGVSPS